MALLPIEMHESKGEGGGREAPQIHEHALGSERSYVNALGWKFKADGDAPLGAALKHTHQAALEALTATTHGQLPARGPRGGVYWIVSHASLASRM